MTRVIALLLLGLLTVSLGACQDEGVSREQAATSGKTVQGAADKGAERPRVRLETNRGDIVLALRPDKAPETVANFLRYVRDGHYAGTIFHRVIPGFMIQGGGYTAEFEAKPTREPIANEADNGLHNGVGTVAMARTSRPHSATDQFFINVADNDFLDFRSKSQRGWGYAVFGRVVAGMAVVEAIAATPTGAGGPFPKDVPQEAVVIERATVVGAESAD
jgi:peptidyl-prolyl cis-trans isomerase A (cyclophilin A)/peptidyl-prolyl cis-trans isomerase B (cyclophilin B)